MTKGGKQYFEIEEIVVPLPGDFNDKQRTIIDRSMKIIGINNTYFISEETSILRHLHCKYVHDIDLNQSLLMIDFDEKTFQINFIYKCWWKFNYRICN